MQLCGQSVASSVSVLEKSKWCENILKKSYLNRHNLIIRKVSRLLLNPKECNNKKGREESKVNWESKRNTHEYTMGPRSLIPIEP